MSIDGMRVPVDRLTQRCNAADLGFETTDDVEPLEGTIGQERAISALELGLDIDADGFNLFIAGPSGTGRNTALRSYVDRIALKKPAPPDWGYVYNFQEPAHPIGISLPCGMVRRLCRQMDDLVDTCRREIPKAFESDGYTHRLEEVMKGVQARRQALTNEMEKAAIAEGFTLVSGPTGITPVPLKDNRPMSQEDFSNLPEEERDGLKRRAEKVQHAVNHGLAELRRLNKETEEQTRRVDADLVRFTLTPLVDELQKEYAGHAQVVGYLDQVESDMVKNLEIFKTDDKAPSAGAAPPGFVGDEDPFIKYRVNDLVDNTSCVGAPIIFEHSPTYYNLFGRIDYRMQYGTPATDHMMIKAGALHVANGGYLVLQARDLLTSALSWDALKRALRSKQIRVENIGEQHSPLPSTTLRPQPIPFEAKVVIVGSPDIMRLLQTHDEDFRKLFKVTAEFDNLMGRTDQNMARYASFVSARCRESGLRPFHNTAVARVIDHSSRLVAYQDKLTTRFMDVSDILTEADYWAGADAAAVVMGEHVKRAIDQKEYRVSLTEDRLQEIIADNTIHISTQGRVLGQVNGLAVLSSGNHTFGKPSRITASVSLGRGQVVNVERETKLSGKIHDKGFMILKGYIQGQYGRDKPLSLSASIGFEQTYSEVDGDSASSTELYALISALAGLPINQALAVTGSVNQAGEVQAIGGAILKIEGFFNVCKTHGLTGDQGVIIPRDNVKNLVLKDEVVEAVEDGKFHIYAVSNVDEGIEVLTGVAAGRRAEDGAYPEGTVHNLVEQRLHEMAKNARDYGKDRDRNESDKRDNEEEANETPPGPGQTGRPFGWEEAARAARLGGPGYGDPVSPDS